MGIWAAVKYALNSTLGTSSFLSLDKMIQAHGTQTFTEDGTFTVPAGVTKILVTAFGAGGGGGRYDEMIGKFTGNNTCACGFSIGFERIVMLLLERGYEIPTNAAKKAYLIEKNMPADKLLPILKQAEEERRNGVQVNISIMKKNKKFQKEQMTAEGYTEFVEFFNK